jgi:hypothetical protein
LTPHKNSLQLENEMKISIIMEKYMNTSKLLLFALSCGIIASISCDPIYDPIRDIRSRKEIVHGINNIVNESNQNYQQPQIMHVYLKPDGQNTDIRIQPGQIFQIHFDKIEKEHQKELIMAGVAGIIGGLALSYLINNLVTKKKE